MSYSDAYPWVLFGYGSQPPHPHWPRNAQILERGFEVACHGQRWIDYQFVAEETERADMLRNIDGVTRLIGRPGRIGALVRLLDHTRRHQGVWFSSREGIARHWIARHPASGVHP